MKYLSQITLITAMSLVGELFTYFIPLPIPGSIYGLVLLLVLLMTGLVKLSQVKAAGDFFLSLMPIMFVSPLVGLIENTDAYRGLVLPVLLASTVSTFLVMAVTGVVSQALIKKTEGKEGHRDA
ncbi:MAG: CidA/LrgA family protein [Clostridia bacterium]|nr:CidA/LrgA family protein [Clostridia bacterium]